MSEVAEKEIEVVAGVITAVTQKKPDTWQIMVDVGKPNPRGLWTKDAELVKAMEAKFGQHGAFVCSASYWTNQSGQEIRSLWIDSVSEGNGEVPESTPPRSTPDTAPSTAAGRQAAPSGNVGRVAADAMTKEEWARKDAAIHKMACIKTAADALKHTLPSDPSPEDITSFLARVAILSGAWHRSVLAVRDDPAGEDIPFSPGAADHG